METGVTSASACDPDLVWIGTFIFLCHIQCIISL